MWGKRSITHPLNVLGLLFAAFMLGLAGAQQVELEQEVFEIARQLRCPTCISESVADSDATISREMRSIIREQLQEGRSRAQILAYFQESHGDWILLEPPRRGLHLIVWLLPVAAGLFALTALVYFFRRWTLNSQAPIKADPEELERVRQLLGKEGR